MLVDVLRWTFFAWASGSVVVFFVFYLFYKDKHWKLFIPKKSASGAPYYGYYGGSKLTEFIYHTVLFGGVCACITVLYRGLFAESFSVLMAVLLTFWIGGLINRDIKANALQDELSTLIEWEKDPEEKEKLKIIKEWNERTRLSYRYEVIKGNEERERKKRLKEEKAKKKGG